VGRALGVTLKTAWFMLHRIRMAMQTGTFDKMQGEVEADETFIGGAARFMHKGKKAARAKDKLGGMFGQDGGDGPARSPRPDGPHSRVHAVVTYVSVEPFHLHLYVDEHAFRYDTRRDARGDGGRFLTTLGRSIGRRITYKKSPAHWRRRSMDGMRKKRPPPTSEDAQFTDLLRRIVAVPKEEVAKKEAEYQRERAGEALRPGRKKKRR
jgi:hypothetical protein